MISDAPHEHESDQLAIGFGPTIISAPLQQLRKKSPQPA
jgi:hypothetical protein